MPSSELAERGIQANRDSLSVERVRELRAFDRPGIERLVRRAVAAVRYPGASPTAVYDELWSRAEDRNLGIFIGYEKHVEKALALIILPASALMMAPQIAIAYNEGRPALARVVARRLREWLMAGGHDRILGVNLWRSDAVFIRAFRHMGRGRRVGSLVEFML